MICQLYDSWYRENCINMLSDQNTVMNWNLSLMTACIIVGECTIKVLKHWKLYKDAYILQESFATTDKSYPSPCRNYLLPLYLSVTLYACAQREEESTLLSNVKSDRVIPLELSGYSCDTVYFVYNVNVISLVVMVYYVFLLNYYSMCPSCWPALLSSLVWLVFLRMLDNKKSSL